MADIPKIAIKGLVPAVVQKPALGKGAFDPKVKHGPGPSVSQPKVRCKFAVEVASRGVLYAAGSEADLPLDQAHSLHRFLAK